LNAFFLLLGVVLLDALWTTLWVDGNASPLSSRLTTWIWQGTRALFRRRQDRWMSLNGPLTLAVIVLTWVVLLWAGWTFVFAADDDAILSTRDGTLPSWTGRIYFVAYTMFTMGNGDFTPKGESGRSPRRSPREAA